jgi:hypothetical protein
MDGCSDGWSIKKKDKQRLRKSVRGTVATVQVI